MRPRAATSEASTNKVRALRMTGAGGRSYFAPAAVGIGLTNGVAGTGGGGWVIGSRSTGYLGWEVLTASSTVWPGWMRKLEGKPRLRVKFFPGCTSWTWTVTPSPLTDGSDSFKGALPSMRTVTG